MPVMFLRKRVVPSMPPSFVKLRRAESALMIGEGTSIPIRLQVPLERYAKRSSAAGTAAMADAVSCPATAMTGIPLNSPIFTPGWTMGRSTSVRMASFFSSSLLNWRLPWSIIPDVEAMVYSHTLLPVSMYDSRSGTKRISFAQRSGAKSSCVWAYSWKMELKFRIWMPVAAYSSSRGTVS